MATEDAPFHLLRAVSSGELLAAAGSSLFSVHVPLSAPSPPHPIVALPKQHIAMVRDAVMVASSRWGVTSGDDKRVVLWQRSGSSWRWEGTVTLPKKVAHVALDVPTTGVHQGVPTVLAADKFGQVLALPRALFDVAGGASGRAVTVDGEGAASGGARLLAGHYAMITAMLLIEGPRRLLVTADRDEKVRVARYPAAFDVVAYCLGHGAFVTTVLDLGSRGNDETRWLLSGGADGRLCLWNALRGHLASRLELPGIVNVLVHVGDLVLVALEAEPALRVIRVSHGIQPELAEVAQLPLTAPLLAAHAHGHPQSSASSDLLLVLALQTGHLIVRSVRVGPASIDDFPLTGSVADEARALETVAAQTTLAFCALSAEAQVERLKELLFAAVKKGANLASSARGPPRDEDED